MQGLRAVLSADWSKEPRKRAVYRAEVATRRVWRLSGSDWTAEGYEVRYVMGRSRTSGDAAIDRWHERWQVQSATNGGQTHRSPAERLRTVAEAAQEFGLSVHTVRAWVAARRIAHVRLGRAIRIPAEEIRRIIQENTVPAVE